jgi:hypothetical protein
MMDSSKVKNREIVQRKSGKLGNRVVVLAALSENDHVFDFKKILNIISLSVQCPG